jgi:hypothetical protein
MPRVAKADPNAHAKADFALHVALITKQMPDDDLPAQLRAWMEGPMGLANRLGRLPFPGVLNPQDDKK